MTDYEIEQTQVGVYAKTLEAETVDTVNFAEAVEDFEVRTNGDAPIYFTIDGTEPTVEGEGCFELPAVASVRTVNRKANFSSETNSVVKLISAGTPEYSVSKAFVS